MNKTRTTAILLWMLAALLTPQQALSASKVLRVCVDSAPYPPFSMPDREGTVQLLARLTAEGMGIKLEFVATPINRCRFLLAQGEVDALNAAAFVPQNRALAEFPQVGDKDDPARAIATVRVGVFRHKSGLANWDGKQFTNVKAPILVPLGHAAFIQRLRELGQPYDEGARTPMDNLRKLHAGRGELLILLENDGRELIAHSELEGKIELLPHPFAQQQYYFAFSKKFYADNHALADAFWREVEKQKRTDTYLEAAKRIR
jgi:polar amino acid transport system substrate-binding protein